MATRRQQRSPNYRGQVQPPNRYTRNVIPIIPAAAEGGILYLNAPSGTTGLLQLGIPRVIRSSPFGTPTQCHIAGGEIQLVYGSDHNAGCTFFMAAGDPAIRTNGGDYLAPVFLQTQTIPWPPIPVATMDWELQPLSGPYAEITFAPELAFVSEAQVWKNLTKTEDGTATQIDPHTIHVDFPSAVDHGDLIYYPSEVPGVVSLDLEIPLSKTVEVP